MKNMFSDIGLIENVESYNYAADTSVQMCYQFISCSLMRISDTYPYCENTNKMTEQTKYENNDGKTFRNRIGNNGIFRTDREKSDRPKENVSANFAHSLVNGLQC